MFILIFWSLDDQLEPIIIDNHWFRFLWLGSESKLVRITVVRIVSRVMALVILAAGFHSNLFSINNP